MKKLTSDKLAEFLFASKNSETAIDFAEDRGCGNWAWYRAEIMAFADAPMAIINYYGGGCPFVYDFSEFDDLATLKMALKSYFKRYAIEEVFVKEKAFNDAYRGWVPVDERKPEPYLSVMVRGGIIGGSTGTPAHWDGEIWRLDTGAPLIGVAQWKLP